MLFVTAVAFTSRSPKNAVVGRLAASRKLFSDDPSVSRREAWESAATTAAAAAGISSSGLWLPGSANAMDVVSNPASTTNSVPTVRLGKSSLEVSRTIQGYWQLAGGHGLYREPDAIANMKAHFDAGITTFDTADIYGPSELIIGNYIQEQPKAIPCTKFCCFRNLEVSRSLSSSNAAFWLPDVAPL